ncbi:MAG: type II secretion system F family protein [Haloglomus sp.]
MVSPLLFGPALVPLTIVAVLLVGRVNPHVNRRVTGIAREWFGDYVGDNLERKQILQAAYVSETYRAYAAKTYLYALLLGITGGVTGAYVVGGMLFAIPLIGDAIAVLPNTIVSLLGQPSEWQIVLDTSELAALFVGSTLAAGTITGALTYSLRWRLPQSHAEARRRRINEGLARTVAFLYALSRGGMPFPDILRTLAHNRTVYGETADEISVAVREMDLFGTDMVSAVQKMSERTPSEDFKTFSENLSSVLQSGQSLSVFLNDQYERYQEEAEERQAEVLELLATLAEGYVTVLVAGVLFLLTVLLVFGLTTTNTLNVLKGMAYLIIPLANIVFMIFLAGRLELLGISREGSAAIPDESEMLNTSGSDTADIRAADGGQVQGLESNFERLAAYDRLSTIQGVLRRPLQTVLRNPVSILYVTVPVAVVVTLARLPTALTGAGVNVRVLDDLLLQAGLFVFGTFAIVRYLYKRRLDRIEAATPELLERLASLNEAGMSIVESFNRVRGSDLGVLTEEVERIWADIKLGANVDEALVRFGRRTRTVPITRAVTLLTNAMQASSNIGDVLRIAATQARADLKMRRRRRQQMLTYLVVIYVSFVVFLVIIVAVQQVLVPALPETVPTPDSNRLGVSAEQFARLGGVNKAAYTLVFFHTALIQALVSGFVAGQLGEGTVKDGAKHATVMLGVAYIAFLLMSSPVATVQVGETVQTERYVVVDSVDLSDGGYLVVRRGSVQGEVLGRSEYLPAGRSKNVRIEFGTDVPDGATIVIIPHLDTNDNQQYEYDGGKVDRPYPPSVAAVAARTKID